MESAEGIYEDLIEQELIADYGGISELPNLKHFVMKYAKSLEGNDQKAAGIFRYYETLERVRSLQIELLNIKKNAVSRSYLRGLLGKKRSNHLGSYEDWAKRMLNYLSSESSKL